MSNLKNTSYHHSVLCKEVLEFIEPALVRKKCESSYIADATIGMGGHAHAILTQHDNCKLDAVDIDSEMISRAKIVLDNYSDRVSFYNQWFDDFFIEKNSISSTVQYDAILMDLGMCMYHFKESGRGFSRHGDEPLDMRLSMSTSKVTAADIINTYSEQDLANIFFLYGEESKSYLWAKRIVWHRKHVSPLLTTKDLLYALQLGKKPSDKKTIIRIFQAVRIEVNAELKRIYMALAYAWQLLSHGGRLLVISFHSLEDRIEKNFSKILSGKLKNDDQNPIHKSSNFFQYSEALHIWMNMSLETGFPCTKKPIIPSYTEVQQYPESRSAKLRVIEKKSISKNN